MADLLISYSRRDLAFARRLTAGLEARGKDVWVDLDDIMPSAPWMDEIRVAIAEADSVVVVISPDSVTSEVCRTELQAAVDLNKRLVPVVARPTPIGDVPASLAALNFLDFSAEPSDESFEAGITRLINVLDTDLDAVHLHTRLLLRTTEWEDSHQDPARLLRGRQLNEAEQWLATQGERNPAPTSGQVSLIMASRRAAIRRQRGSMAVAATVALGLIGLSIFSVLQWHSAVVQRGQADSRADSAEAQDQLQPDPPRALDLALRGFHAGNTAQAQTALRNAVAASELRAVLPPMKQVARVEAKAADGGGAQGQVSYDPSGSYVALTNSTGEVEVWRWRAPSGPGSYRDPYRLATRDPLQADFTDDGHRLLVVEQDGELLEWNWKAAPTAVVLRRGLSNAVLNQRGDYLASFSFSASTVAVTHAASGKSIALIRTGPVTGAAFSPDGSLLATWDGDGAGAVSVWRTSDGQLAETLGTAPVVGTHYGEVPLAITAQDDRMAVAGNNEISVYTLGEPTQAPKVLTMTAPPGVSADSDGIYTAGSLAWSPNGEELAAGGHDQALRVWSGNLGGQTFVGPVGNGTGGVAFSPDDSDVASSDDTSRATVWAWEADSDEGLSLPSGVPPYGATTDHSGHMVAYTAFSATDPSLDVVGLWDWRRFTTYPLTTLNNFTGVDLAFSPNGQWLAVSSEGNVEIWDVRTRRQIAFLPLSPSDADVTDLTFDASGRELSGVETPSTNFKNRQQLLLEWRWPSSSTASQLGGFTLTNIGDMAIAGVASDGSIRFVYRHDYMSWGGSPGERARVMAKDVVPTGNIAGATFIDGGQKMVFQAHGQFGRQTELVTLRTGATIHALGQYSMEGSYTHSPDGRLVAGTALNGDEVVWDENPSDTPVAIPTPDNRSTVTLAPHDLLIAEPTGLLVVPDAYCGPLNQVVALAEKLLVHPTAVAEATSFNDS
jgi:WD40 repeat protein